MGAWREDLWLPLWLGTLPTLGLHELLPEITHLHIGSKLFLLFVKFGNECFLFWHKELSYGAL